MSSTMRLPLVQRKRVPEFLDEVPQGGGSAAEWSQDAAGGRCVITDTFTGEEKDLEGRALTIGI